jgi:hypothetical protein
MTVNILNVIYAEFHLCLVLQMSTFMLSVNLHSVIMLNVVMLNVVAPLLDPLKTI